MRGLMLANFLNRFFHLSLKVSRHAFIKKIFRSLLKLIPKKTVLPILSGSIRGKKWIMGSSPYEMLLGFYELEVQQIFEKLIKTGSVLYDIGSHVGFFAILGSKLVGREGKVIAFEPVPQHLYFLKEHIRLNQCHNVIVMDVAVSSASGEATMRFIEYDMWGSYLSAGFHPEGNLKIKTVSLDDIVFSYRIPPPDIIKIDIEGAEILALQGGIRTINEFKPTIILSTHGEEIKKECCSLLASINYKCSPLKAGVIVREDELLCIHSDN